MKNTLVVSGRIRPTFILALVIASFSITQTNAASVPVEEIGGGTQGGRATPSVSAAGTSDPYYQLQLLREELRQLRGMLEEQNNELTMLKKRQREDYLDLDRRLAGSPPGALPGSPPGALPDSTSTAGLPGPGVPSQPSSSTNGGETAAGVPAAGSFPAQPTDSPYGVPASTGTQTSLYAGNEIEEQTAYDQAYGLLKARKIDEARAALQKFLVDYPRSSYAANAHYWLGEVYLLDNELDAAAAQFLAVIEQSPGHRKVNDATFKLGKVYYLQNKPDQAKVLLERVAKGSDSSARLAQDYLSRYY